MGRPIRAMAGGRALQPSTPMAEARLALWEENLQSMHIRAMDGICWGAYTDGLQSSFADALLHAEGTLLSAVSTSIPSGEHAAIPVYAVDPTGRLSAAINQ